MLHALIVDDEALARTRLARLLMPFVEAGRVEIAGEVGNGHEALAFLREDPVDLVFLDIRMPELDGFDVLERLAPENRPVVIFTTAYDAYALRAFEANAVDYLLKPISKERLGEAIAKAERLLQVPESRRVSERRLAQLLDWLDAQAEADRPAAGGAFGESMRQISIPYRDRILVVPVARLVTAEISEGITRLFILSDEPSPRPAVRQHLVNYTLDQLEANLPPDFMRVHRSAIVNLEHVREMIPWFSGRYKLVLTGEHEVIASRERSKLLKERLML